MRYLVKLLQESMAETGEQKGQMEGVKKVVGRKGVALQFEGRVRHPCTHQYTTLEICIYIRIEME